MAYHDIVGKSHDDNTQLSQHNGNPQTNGFFVMLFVNGLHEEWTYIHIYGIQINKALSRYYLYAIINVVLQYFNGIDNNIFGRTVLFVGFYMLDIIYNIQPVYNFSVNCVLII